VINKSLSPLPEIQTTIILSFSSFEANFKTSATA
jgi:hypothetical protein